MPFEILTGLDVADPEQYEMYRKDMKPILEKYGGGFRYDFVIKETLKSESDKKITRLFAIYFKDKASRLAFFSDPAYLKVRKQYYEPSVRARTVIAEYERE